MKKLFRFLTVLSVLFMASSSVATEFQKDGGDPPPRCAPNDPSCHP